MSVKCIKDSKRNQTKNLLIIIGIFFIAQCIYVFAPNPCASVSDEFTYKQIALDIFNGNAVSSFHYPFLYPLVLSVSFIFGDGFYYAMLLINIVIKTIALVVATRMLNKMDVDRQRVIWVLTLVAVSPVYFMYSNWIMSENLYAPLLFLTLLFFIRYRNILVDENVSLRKKLLLSGVAGLLAVLLYETKYLSLALFPVLFLYWFWNAIVYVIKSFVSRKKQKYSLTRQLGNLIFEILIYTVVVVFVISTVVLVYCNLSNSDVTISLVKDTLGFSTGSGPENTGYKIVPEYKWIICYTAYAFLCSVVLIFASLKNCIEIQCEHGLRSKSCDLFFLNLTLVAFIYVAARHSSFVSYNVGGAMLKLLGRYVAYAALIWVLILWIVNSSSSASEKSKKDNEKEQYRLLSVAVIGILTILSYLILYRNIIWNPEEDWLYSLRGLDNIGFLKIGVFLVLIIVIGLFLLNARCSRTVVLMIYGVVSIINILCSVNADSFYSETQEYVRTTKQMMQKYGDEDVSIYSTSIDKYIGALQCYSFLLHNQLNGEIWFLQAGFNEMPMHLATDRTVLFTLNKNDIDYATYEDRAKLTEAEDSDIIYFEFEEDVFDERIVDSSGYNLVKDNDSFELIYSGKSGMELVLVLNDEIIPVKYEDQYYVFSISEGILDEENNCVLYNLNNLIYENIPLDELITR